MRPTSASQRTEISCAFLSSPVRRLEKVTCRLVLFSIRFNSTLPLPIFALPPLPLASTLNYQAASIGSEGTTPLGSLERKKCRRLGRNQGINANARDDCAVKRRLADWRREGGKEKHSYTSYGSKK
ncbi:hypothetical protein ZIOFF_011878 [Zingiber officinale]|uniref:Uncharacterized protein n=1 Tax=Zingiber officinale TaxID=94328 RepID=A0A8J5HRQ8_ZINOF|nr:hypothetical protein ZIOFF_011878 [Zingiber officinale]